MFLCVYTKCKQLMLSHEIILKFSSNSKYIKKTQNILACISNRIIFCTTLWNYLQG